MHQLDFILDTVGGFSSSNPSTPPKKHREYCRDIPKNGEAFYDDIVDALAAHGRYVIIGLSVPHVPISGNKLIFKDLSILGSLIGGVSETQEKIDFCVKYKIFPDISIIPKEKLQEKLQLLERGNDTTLRFVILTAQRFTEKKSRRQKRKIFTHTQTHTQKKRRVWHAIYKSRNNTRKTRRFFCRYSPLHRVLRSS